MSDCCSFTYEHVAVLRLLVWGHISHSEYVFLEKHCFCTCIMKLQKISIPPSWKTPPPPPLWKHLNEASYISLKFFGLKRHPTPQEIPIPSVGKYGYFLDQDISISQFKHNVKQQKHCELCNNNVLICLPNFCHKAYFILVGGTTPKTISGKNIQESAQESCYGSHKKQRVQG